MSNTRLVNLLADIAKNNKKGGGIANNFYVGRLATEIIAALQDTTQATKAAAETDVGAITAYTAHSSGGVTVTSTAATDLDTTAAAVETLRDEVAAARTTINSLIAKLETAGILT